MHRSIGVKSEPKFKSVPSTNLQVHNYLKIIISNSIIQTLPTKEVTTYYLTSRLDHFVYGLYIRIHCPTEAYSNQDFTQSHTHSLIFLRLTYSLEEGSVYLPPSTKTCLGTKKLPGGPSTHIKYTCIQLSWFD